MNNRFGKLTILKDDTERKGYIICKCDCGNIKSIRKTSLTKTKQPTMSCGCIQRAVASKTGNSNIKQNSKEQIDTNIKFNTAFQIIRTDEPPVNNTSGHKGVSYCKSRDKWEAYIHVHNKRINLGRYKTLEEAIEVRKLAEKEIYEPLLEKLKTYKGD